MKNRVENRAEFKVKGILTRKWRQGKEILLVGVIKLSKRKKGGREKSVSSVSVGSVTCHDNSLPLFATSVGFTGSAKGSVNIDNRINRYWKGSVNRESNPGGTTEDLGCEPRCPNDTSAIKRGDRRSQSVQSRSHALLLPLLWIRTKQDPADLKYLLP